MRLVPQHPVIVVEGARQCLSEKVQPGPDLRVEKAAGGVERMNLLYLQAVLRQQAQQRPALQRRAAT